MEKLPDNIRRVFDVRIKLLRPNAIVPAQATPGAAGRDLYACFGPDPAEYTVLNIGQRVSVPTGIAIGLPKDHVGLCCPRSGLAMRDGITVLNAPGVIDEDYTGEICVLLINRGERRFEIHQGDRIAQLVVVPVAHTSFTIVDDLEATKRGVGGFGSTGR